MDAHVGLDSLPTSTELLVHSYLFTRAIDEYPEPNRHTTMFFSDSLDT